MKINKITVFLLHAALIFLVFVAFMTYMSLSPNGWFGYEPSGMQLIVPGFFVVPLCLILGILMFCFKKQLKLKKFNCFVPIIIALIIELPLLGDALGLRVPLTYNKWPKKLIYIQSVVNPKYEKMPQLAKLAAKEAKNNKMSAWQKKYYSKFSEEIVNCTGYMCFKRVTLIKKPQAKPKSIDYQLCLSKMCVPTGRIDFSSIVRIPPAGVFWYCYSLVVVLLCGFLILLSFLVEEFEPIDEGI